LFGWPVPSEMLRLRRPYYVGNVCKKVTTLHGPRSMVHASTLQRSTLHAPQRYCVLICHVLGGGCGLAHRSYLSLRKIWYTTCLLKCRMKLEWELGVGYKSTNSLVCMLVTRNTDYCICRALEEIAWARPVASDTLFIFSMFCAVKYGG
jgi:hypothetical protein